ncbi:hypothetical protein AVEN_98416-1 [Araneus ventricosus]|uniref:Uncharacterized protein n=1 Tax=Araneus ventricosus TaxID=182803 RepID=A0A4Y2VUM0_ARAVE|nr:hypothetical protein AVEN_98416-1 [Araneus ventricosus]
MLDRPMCCLQLGSAITSPPPQANSTLHAKIRGQWKKPMRIRAVWSDAWISRQYGYPPAPFGLPDQKCINATDVDTSGKIVKLSRTRGKRNSREFSFTKRGKGRK